MSSSSSANLFRVAHAMLLFMTALVALAALLLLLIAAALPFDWAQSAIALSERAPGVDTGRLLPWAYLLMAIGAVSLAAIWKVLGHLRAILDSASRGDPFIAGNVARLRSIGWLMIFIQVVGIAMTMTAHAVADIIGQRGAGFELSLNGILAILLAFVLAEVFQRGAAMREDLEGTV